MKEKINYKPLINESQNIIEKVREWRNSPDIRKYMLNNDYITKKEHAKWYEQLKNIDDYKFWVIYVGEVPTGSIYLKGIDFDNKKSNWGIYIGEDEFRGEGIAKNAIYNLLNFSFKGEMNLRRIYTKVLENNQVAYNLYKKMGFEKEGLLREHLIRNEDFLDVMIMGILEKEWEEKKDNIKRKHGLIDVDLPNY